MSKKKNVMTFENDDLPRAKAGVPIVDVTDLHVRFPSEDGIVHAVRGVNFSVNSGKSLAS